MRIITWNLNHGKAAKVWPRLQKRLGFDLVFLQESPQPAWDGGLLWKHVLGCNWGSAVAVTSGTLSPIPVAGYEGWVIGGSWNDHGQSDVEGPITVFSIHSPTGNAKQKRKDYVKEVGIILDRIRQLSPPPNHLILGGDFNFKSLGKRHADEAIQTTAAEEKVLAAFDALGLVSCWSISHPDRPLPQTLRWFKDKSIPYHCDGIFVPKTWKLSDSVCEVLTSEVFELSDHYPVATWF